MHNPTLPFLDALDKWYDDQNSDALRPDAYLIEHATMPDKYIRHVALYPTTQADFVSHSLIKIDNELVRDAQAFRDMVDFQIFPDFSLTHSGEVIAFDKTGTQIGAVPIENSKSTKSVRAAINQLKEKL